MSNPTSNTTSNESKAETEAPREPESRRHRRDKEEQDGEEKDLTGVYAAVQSGIWLIGLAILFWTGDWFPGILILVAISGITQAVLQNMAKKQEQQVQVAETRQAAAQLVPANCPTCGAAISASTVVWTSPTAAQCPYCKAAVPLTSKA